MTSFNPATRQWIKSASLGGIAATGLLNALPGLAQNSPLTAGKEYRVVNPSVSVDAPGKIEVIEFFWFACPHCAALEPALHDWSKRLPADVVFRRAHVPFNEIKHQQLFYTLETMGKFDALVDKVFSAIHVDRNRMDTPEKIIAVLSKHGLDTKAFNEAWESFSVQTRMRKGTSLAASYKIESVPSLAVNGKYVTSPSMAGGNQGVLDVLNQLIARERAAARK